MGGRYSGYRRVGFHDTHSALAGGATERALARPGREFPQRCLACDRTIHPARPQSSRVRSFDRGYEGLYAALEDQHAALSTPREKYAAPGVQMPGVHGRVALWALSQAAEQLEERARGYRTVGPTLKKAWGYRPVVKRPRTRCTEAIRTVGPTLKKGG